MKSKLLKTLTLLFVLIVATSCSSTVSSHLSAERQSGILVDSGGHKEYIESDIEIAGRIEGSGSATYLFGIFPLGPTHSVEGVWNDGSLLNPDTFLKKDHAKMEATYNALVSSGADLIVEPRFEVVTQKIPFIMTTVNARVTGFKGTIVSYTHYKQDKPSYMEENYGYAPPSGSLKVDINK